LEGGEKVIIDFHCHVGIKESMWGRWENDGKSQVKAMDKYGIDIAAIYAVPSLLATVEQFQKENEFILNAVKQFPDRLVGFCTINPLHEKKALQQIEQYISERMKGIKLYPPGSGYPIDSPIVDPIIEKAIELDVPVSIHTDYSTKLCTPYQFATLARRHPKAKLVMLHMGLDSDMIYFTPEIVKGLDNVYLEMSGTPPIPKHVIERPVQILGSEKVLFGTDHPAHNAACVLKKVEEAEVSQKDKENILEKNAKKLLKL
jgi:hypothetical protein